jgi:hypothetical protein
VLAVAALLVDIQHLVDLVVEATARVPREPLQVRQLLILVVVEEDRYGL